MAQAAATADPKRPDPKHNVTGARQAYYDRISKFNMAPLWEKLRQLVGNEPEDAMRAGDLALCGRQGRW